MPSLTVAFAALLQRTTVLLWVPAFGVTVLNYAACLQFLEPYGLGVWHKFLAATPAVSGGVLFWVFFAWLIEVVTRLPRAERAKINPFILLMSALIVLSSTYPHVQKMGGGYAAEIEDKQYVEMVVARADAVKAAVNKVEPIAGVERGAAKTLRGHEERERRGLLSGFDSGTVKPGPVSDWIGGIAARLEAEAESMSQARQAAGPIIERVNASAKQMRAAIEEKGKGKDMAARRIEMQAAGDAFRTALIELGNTLPISPARALAMSLQGDMPEPALSQVAQVRQSQLQAVQMVKSEFGRIGKSIDEALDDLGTIASEPVPPYDPPPIPILVLKHADKLLNVIGVAIAIDFLGLALYFFAARVNDAMKRRSDEELRAMTVAVPRSRLEMKRQGS